MQPATRDKLFGFQLQIYSKKCSILHQHEFVPSVQPQPWPETSELIIISGPLMMYIRKGGINVQYPPSMFLICKAGKFHMSHKIAKI